MGGLRLTRYGRTEKPEFRIRGHGRKLQENTSRMSQNQPVLATVFRFDGLLTFWQLP